MSHYSHRTDDCLSGLNQTLVAVLTDKLAAYERELAEGRDALAAPVLARVSMHDDIADIEAAAKHIRKHFTHVIVCGAGGSGLSGKVLTNLRLYADAPHLYVLDNIDPSAMDALIEHCPPEKTCVIAISKSGATAETLSQLYALFAHFTARLGKKSGEHFVVITTAGDNPMRRTASEHGMKILEHPADIGGRFSMFTSVGLLPAALVGLDIRALRSGAQSVIAELGSEVHAARLGAAIQYDAMTRGQNMSVMLPYCERLSGFSAWYRQSWAESLGKGGKGTTPISAVGTTDQHSQLQLYLDGPKDKFFTMIMHDRAGTGQKIHAPDFSGLEYLHGKTTGDIMAAEQQATLETLVGHGRPVRVIRIGALDEAALGALLMHFTLEIFFMAKLLDVNAFDQPAVEEGKRAARDYLLGIHP